MRKLARVDVDDFAAYRRGERVGKFTKQLIKDLVAIINQRTGDIVHPYFDNKVVRWELWIDDDTGKVVVRIYRPRPKEWSGAGRALMTLDYTIVRGRKEVDHVQD